MNWIRLLLVAWSFTHITSWTSLEGKVNHQLPEATGNDVELIDRWEAEAYDTFAQEATTESIDSEPADPPQELRLTLENAIRLALSAERRLGAAVANVTVANLNVDLALSEFDLQWLPRADTGLRGGGSAGTGFSVGFGSDFYKKFPYGTRVNFQPSIGKTAHDFNTDLRASITQPLLRGFGKDHTFASVYAAQYASRNARRALYQAQCQQILQAIQGVYEIVKQEQLVHVDKDTYLRMQKFCISTKIKEKINLCEALDVYRAETELKNAEDSLNTSLERLQDAKDNLRDILALPLDIPLVVDVPIEYTPITITLEEGLQIAFQNRIEIGQAQDRLGESKRLVRREKNNLWPELNITIDYSSYKCDEIFSNVWASGRDSKWGIGFTSSTLPNNANYEQSMFALRDSQRNVEQVRDDIILDVKKTLRTLQKASDRIILQDEQIKNAQKEYHLARLKFEHGFANNFDLIQAEKNSRMAQTALISAIIEHKVNEFRLLYVLGTLADKPGECL